MPPGVNLGMAAVEMGLRSVAAEAGVRVVPRRHPALLHRREFAVDGEAVRRRMDVGLGPDVPLDSLPQPEEGLLLYWGDFHHMRQYVEAVARADSGDLRRTLHLLLGAGADPQIQCSLQSFGTTLLFNTAQDLADPRYGAALRGLLETCSHVWVRDPISAGIVRRMRPGGGSCLGVDAALLAERPASYRDGGQGRYTAVFLGRTVEAHPALLVSAERLGRRMEAPARWLDWGNADAFPALAEAEIRSRLGHRPEELPTPYQVLSDLAGAALVVTDSYHLALIAWGWGIPAVTISSAGNILTPASVDGGRGWAWRDKRELAASQYGALDLLIRPEEWSDPQRLQQRLDHVTEVVQEGRFMPAVSAAITADARAARRELLSAWSALGTTPMPTPPAVPSLTTAPLPATSPAPVSGLTPPRTSPTGPQFRAAAVVVLRNERQHVHGLIRQLVGDGLDVVVIDNESSDGSAEMAREWLGRGVLEVRQRPFNGVWSQITGMGWKEEVLRELDHDWVMHVDADEWPHPCRPGERLIDLFARADAAGATALNFEEFTFVPDRPLGPGDDPREYFCAYYHFAPSANRLMRAWRRDAGLSSLDGAGHVLSGDSLRLHDELGVLRHYPLLNPDHLRTKYMERRFDHREVALGWHHNRVGLRPQDLTLDGPALRHLSQWTSRDFDRSVPVSRHCWEPGELISTPTDGSPPVPDPRDPITQGSGAGFGAGRASRTCA